MKTLPPHLALRYAGTGVRRLARNACTAWWRPRSGWSPFPVLAVLNPTHDCNLRCTTCFERGVNRVATAWGNANRGAELTLDEYRALIDELARVTPTFYITGGEPLLSDKTLPMIHAIKSHGLYVSMNTNGVLLEEHAAALVASGLDNVIVSLDGPREVHNAIRGDTYDRIARGIARLAKCKADRRARRPALRVQCVISPHNLSALNRTAEAVNVMGVAELRFQHLMFAFSEASFESTADLRALVRHGAVARPRLAPGTLDLATLRTELETLRRRSGPPRIRFEPKLRARDIAGYYRNPTHPFRNDCLSPWRRVVLSAYGGIGPCQGMVLAHYPAQRVLDAWRSDRFRRLRAHIRDTGLFPHCLRCCHRAYGPQRMGIEVH